LAGHQAAEDLALFRVMRKMTVNSHRSLRCHEIEQLVPAIAGRAQVETAAKMVCSGQIA